MLKKVDRMGFISGKIKRVKASKVDNNEINEENNEVEPEEDLDSIIAMTNHSIEDIDDFILDLFVNSGFAKEVLKDVQASNYNNLKISERKLLFARIVATISDVVGKNGFSGDMYIIEESINNESIEIIDGDVYIEKEVFNYKNQGVTILVHFIQELRRYMIETVMDGLFQEDFYDVYPKLEGLAKIYYENMIRSVLYDSWYNYLTKDDKNYYCQPIKFDSTRLGMDITKEYLKMLFDMNKTVDKEMSSLLYTCMGFQAEMDNYKKRRNETIKRNRLNLKKGEEEDEITADYITKTVGDLSKLSDDDFYSLFDMSYFYILNKVIDDQVDLRIEKLANELIRREFCEFDLTNVILPRYEAKYDKEKNTMTIKRIYGGKDEEKQIEDILDLFDMVKQDIILVAQLDDLFHFNDEQEEKDYFIMKEWIKMKTRNFSDISDREVVSDGLNIIVQKSSEILRNLNLKIERAIAKQSHSIKGKSMLYFQSDDARYDFEEFLKGRSKKEVYDMLMEYVTLDTLEMKKAQSQGGR